LILTYKKIYLFIIVYHNIGDDLKARPLCERAVDIAQRVLPPSHLDRQKWQKNLEDIQKELELVVFFRK
jgi:methionyl-tRNA formyltransferase